MFSKGKAKEDIAILMLLSCLVGAFSFLGLGLSIVKSADSEVKDTFTQEYINTVEYLKAKLAMLSEEIKKLSKELEQLEDILRKKKASQNVNGIPDLEKKIEEKKEELKKAEELIRNLEKEIGNKNKEFDEFKKAMAQLDRLKSKIKKLNEELNRLKAILLAKKKDRIPPDSSDIEQKILEKQEQINRAEEKIKELNREIKAKKKMVEVGQLYGTNKGITPQYIECNKNGIIFKPQEIEIPVSDIKNLFVRHIGGYDSVVFLVRPQGFESFIEAREIVEKKGIKAGHEPVDANWQLKYH